MLSSRSQNEKSSKSWSARPLPSICRCWRARLRLKMKCANSESARFTRDRPPQLKGERTINPDNAAPIVTRFAPSPTGYLHLGHVRSALEGWRAARAAGGIFLLRLEDIDPMRCRPEYADAIIDDLAWLGLDWNGPIRRQSEHFADYRAALTRLDEQGLLYPCFCTRR